MWGFVCSDFPSLLPLSTQPSLCPPVPGPLSPGLQNSQQQPLVQVLIKGFLDAQTSCPSQPSARLPPVQWPGLVASQATGLTLAFLQNPGTALLLPHTRPQEERPAPALNPESQAQCLIRPSGTGNHIKAGPWGAGLEFRWGFSSLFLRPHTPELNISPASPPPAPAVLSIFLCSKN